MKGDEMKRKCPDCGKKYVISKIDFKIKRCNAYIKGDEQLCDTCFKDVQQIAYDQSYFGSIAEWGI